MPEMRGQILKFGQSLFYFSRVGEASRTPHQIQAIPLGGASGRDNGAIPDALSMRSGIPG